MWKLTNFISSLLLVLIASLFQSSAASRRQLVGGYGPISDLSDPMVANAAKFAILELFAIENDDMPYEFMSSLQGDQQAFVPRVVRGSEQVVAGLNLKLTLMVLEVVEPVSGESLCRGAMEVQIYLALDQSMEVTEWGDEFTCDQAQVLLEDRLMDEENNEGN
ncbi:unnamed protein product [Cylindrotheca closterium]|uniref:Cystatin domain-containing protein n=1 Tax=Cylindrotheca closterium TaxID=2856 RepID=A0AAD2PU74_9STRA|nr:unnamed protein product [Cylindrotheca closterium]